MRRRVMLGGAFFQYLIADFFLLHRMILKYGAFPAFLGRGQFRSAPYLIRRGKYHSRCGNERKVVRYNG